MQAIKQTPVVAFPEVDIVHEERVAAVLVTKGEDDRLRAYVKDVPGHNPPDPEIVAALVQSVEIANL